MKSVLSYLIPQKLAEFSTKYNTYIRVNDEYGKRKLLVNGSVQSGRYIRSLWTKAFRSFGISARTRFNTILVLGVGGGTVIELLHGQFPDARMICVDIDPVIIDIAKRYFLTGDISYARFVTSDAEKYVEKDSSLYDFIVVDIFIGNAVPEFVRTASFIDTCKHRLSPDGALCINYLQDREYGKKSEAFAVVLNRLFGTVRDFRIANNRFFFASIV